LSVLITSRMFTPRMICIKQLYVTDTTKTTPSGPVEIVIAIQ
jgi:hypothetical protein